MKHVFTGLIKLTISSILLITLFACGGAEERKVKYLEKGKAYLTEKNYDKARIELKNVLQIDPKYAEAYFYMGQVEEANKELRKAVGNYQKTIELNPEYVIAKIKLSKIYVIAGTDELLEKAKQLLAEVRQIQPENSEAKLYEAFIEYKRGSKSKAISEIEALVANDSKLVDGIGLLVSIYDSKDQDAKAIKLLQKATTDNPENILLKITFAKVLANNNDQLGAEKQLKEAIKIEPERFTLQVALSSFYVISKQLDKAEAVLRQSITQNDEDAERYLVLVNFLASNVSVKSADEELKLAIKNKPELYDLKFSQVAFYVKLGMHDKAMSALKQIINEKDNEIQGVKARNLMAQYVLEKGNQEAAKEYVDKVLEEYPNNNDALLISSKLALIKLDAVSAINGLRTVIKNNPKNVEASSLLAQAHELNKESSLAESELKKSIEVNPVNVRSHINYANYLGLKGRIEESVAVVDKAQAYFKNNYDLMEIKLKILASQGKESEILSLLNQMEQADATKSSVNISKGKYYLSKKDTTQAIEQFEKAYEKSRDKFESLQYIVRTYLADNKSDKAIQRLDKILIKNPGDAAANLLMGHVFLSQKKKQQAKLKYELAQKASESWFLPYKSLASIHISEKDFDKAIDVYLDAVEKMKNKVPAQMQLAALYELKQDYKRAMGFYEQVLETSSGNKLAANNYASLLLDYGTESDVPKALELSKGFDKLNEPGLKDTLAWAYTKSGEHAKAVEILKPVVEKSQNIAIFRYHLGYALYKMGDKAAAKSHLEVATASEQKFSGKDNAEELLKTI